MLKSYLSIEINGYDGYILRKQRLIYIRENCHQVGSILFETNSIITQLAMFDLLPRFDQIQFLKKVADGDRNVEVSRTLLVV